MNLVYKTILNLKTLSVFSFRHLPISATPTKMYIRPENPADHPAIDALLKTAFDGTQEANLVDDFRANGHMAIALVAEENNDIMGYIALSRMSSPERALALAPIAILPEKQCTGIGSSLIQKSLKNAKHAGTDIIFVVGDPNYYQRFGFSPETAAPFRCIYAGPYFMALRLSDAPLNTNEVIYPAAFNALE